MRISMKGRHFAVDDELRERVERKAEKIARQVSPLAQLEVELIEERNPAISEAHVAEATLYLKGVTLRASERAEDMGHAVNLMTEDLARQVKRHREKLRGRRKGAKEAPRIAGL